MTKRKTPTQSPSTSKPNLHTRPRSSDVARFHKTDAGNAELFAALFGNLVRYDHKHDRWLLWQEHWWAEDIDGFLQRLAKAAVRWRADAACNLKDDKTRKQHLAWAFESEAKTKLEAALKLAQSEHPIADSGVNWDSDPMLMGVLSGVVDLRTGKLRRGQQSDRITLHSNIRYNSHAKCPRWLQFLDEVFGGNRDLIEFIQRAIGYCVTGDTSEQVLFPCFGTGANGKSTFLEVIRLVLGDYAYNLPFSSFELKSRSGVNNDIAALVGRRFVTALETSESVRLNEARIKSLTGCDPASARFLYHEFFTFIPVAKFWLAFNHKPEVSDDSEGFWRRIRLIPFEQQFPKEKADPQLLEKLKAEAPGILAWAVRGCLEWQRIGLGVPFIVQEATNAYREESDSLAEFLSTRCVLGPSFSVPSTNLWTEYRVWAEANGETCLTRKVFGRRLKAHSLWCKTIGHEKIWTWFGVGLRTNPTPLSSAGVRVDAGVKMPLLIN